MGPQAGFGILFAARKMNVLNSEIVSTIATLEGLYRPIAGELRGVREVIASIWEEAIRLVRLEGTPAPVGGKLLRPALCLLAAGALGGKRLSQYVRLAAAFEALHIASLAHDDVIDRAVMRRGKASLNALWDNHAAVLGGDYLVARAVEMLAEYDSCAVISNAIQSVRCMAEGELYFFGRDDDSIGEEDCIMLAEQKTASLFAQACSAPTYVLEASRHEALYGFGINLGIAFQLVDDLLDITQPASGLGKPACGDLAEGKNTIPIKYLQRALDGQGRERLRSLRGREITGEEQGWVGEMVEQTGVYEKTMRMAREYGDKASGHLSGLPESPYRTSMEGIIEFILVRNS